MGLFEEIHGFGSPADFSNHLRSAAKVFYGTPLRAFLKWFVEHRDYALGRVAELQDGFGKAYVPDRASGEIVRAAARFSLLCAAGELATEAGVTGWLPGQAARSAGTCFKAWLEERGSVVGGDVEAGVRQALAFVEEQGSRFQRFDQTFVPRDRVGFVKTEGGFVQYMFTRGAFESIVCKGHNFRTVRDELIRRKFMIAGEAEHPGQRKVMLPGLGRPRVFVLQIPEDAFEALPLAA